jgi:hypothetical protein
MSSNYQSDTGHHTTLQQYHPVCAAEERKTLDTKYGNMCFQVNHILIDRRFSLKVVQQPKQSRMSGVGEKSISPEDLN